MKIILKISLLLGLLYTQSIFAAFENQGFAKFSESPTGIEFKCEKQCFIMVGQKGTNDYLSLSGTINGNGLLAYGFLNGDQKIIPGETIKIESNIPLDKKFVFNKLQYYSQLPPTIPLLIVIEGNAEGKIGFGLGMNSFGDNFSSGWNDLWTPEKIGYYSINLIYGPKIGGITIIGKYIVLFVLLVVIFFLFSYTNNKKNSFKLNFIYLSLIFFFIYGFRFFFDASSILVDDISFANNPIEKKIYRNYNDIYIFSDFINKNIGTEKDFKLITYQDWPYSPFITYNSWPVEIKDSSKTIVVYDKGFFKLDKGNLIDSRTNKVLASNIEIIKQYDIYSFIAKIK